MDYCRSSGHLSDFRSFKPKNTELLRVMPPSQLFKKSPNFTLVDKTVGNNSTTCTLPCLIDNRLDFKTPFELEHTIIILGEVLLLVIIPMGYSYFSSEINLTYPPRQITFTLPLQCYPRFTSKCGIPLAYSSSNPKVKTARSIRQLTQLYTPFEVYLTTIGGRSISNRS